MKPDGHKTREYLSSESSEGRKIPSTLVTLILINYRTQIIRVCSLRKKQFSGFLDCDEENSSNCSVITVYLKSK